MRVISDETIKALGCIPWYPDPNDVDRLGFQRAPADWNGIDADRLVRDPSYSCGEHGRWRHTGSASDIIGYCGSRA